MRFLALILAVCLSVVPTGARLVANRQLQEQPSAESDGNDEVVNEEEEVFDEQVSEVELSEQQAEDELAAQAVNQTQEEAWSEPDESLLQSEPENRTASSEEIQQKVEQLQREAAEALEHMHAHPETRYRPSVVENNRTEEEMEAEAHTHHRIGMWACCQREARRLGNETAAPWEQYDCTILWNNHKDFGGCTDLVSLVEESDIDATCDNTAETVMLACRATYEACVNDHNLCKEPVYHA